MAIHLQLQPVRDTADSRPAMCVVLLLGLSVLAACDSESRGLSDRGKLPEPPAASCEQPTQTRLEVQVIDQDEAPVAGVVVTLTFDDERDGVATTTDRRGTARFAAVERCASVGIWVARDGNDLGFAQVRLPPAATERLVLRVRR